jgi:hypothetical protein
VFIKKRNYPLRPELPLLLLPPDLEAPEDLLELPRELLADEDERLLLLFDLAEEFEFLDEFDLGLTEVLLLLEEFDLDLTEVLLFLGLVVVFVFLALTFVDVRLGLKEVVFLDCTPTALLTEDEALLDKLLLPEVVYLFWEFPLLP